MTDLEPIHDRQKVGMLTLTIIYRGGGGEGGGGGGGANGVTHFIPWTELRVLSNQIRRFEIIDNNP